MLRIEPLAAAATYRAMDPLFWLARAEPAPVLVGRSLRGWVHKHRKSRRVQVYCLVHTVL